ncbi:helix-turn-helix domain-containing protein [Streptosporangium album]|uniref:helix-turn-helix domain-containing protein n=1 Tax=Streptosporangium album TaxID=47479 RepID=UPI003CD05C10
MGDRVLAGTCLEYGQKRSQSDVRGEVFALRLLEQGMSPDRVADALGVGRESVFRWKRQARSGGTKALRIKKAPGRPRRLTPGQEQTIKAVVRDVTPVRCWARPLCCGRGRWWRW